MPSNPDSPAPVPPPVPVETHPYRASGLKPPPENRVLPDPTRLAPEDAYYSPSLLRTRPGSSNYEEPIRPLSANTPTAASVAALRPPPAVPGAATRKENRKLRGTGVRRRRKGAWKKLLWVKQSCTHTQTYIHQVSFVCGGLTVFRLRKIDPDNYTDTETFLDHLQRNPRVRPYDFWPLVADSTVIVQHVCSVVIFICCFVGIVQGRVSPVSVVCWGSVGTAVAWVLWDWWAFTEHAENRRAAERAMEADDGSSSSSMTSSVVPGNSRPNGQKENQVHGLGLSMAQNEPGAPLRRQSTGLSVDSFTAQDPGSLPPGYANGKDERSESQWQLIYHSSSFLSRNRQRLSTVKSAFLIYFSLLGLSPILKSLTKSTADHEYIFVRLRKRGRRWRDQVSGISIHKRSCHGIDSACFSPPINHARIQPHALLH
jgi:phosphatidylinositol glycan class C protein